MQVAVYPEFRSADGSIWSRGVWSEGVQVTLRHIAGKAKRGQPQERKTIETGTTQIMCVEHLFKEMDNLRYTVIVSISFHSVWLL